MNKKFNLSTIAVCSILLLVSYTTIATAADIMRDDFNYGSDTSNCTENEALTSPDWAWSQTGNSECKDISTYATQRGLISVSSVQSHTSPRALLMNFQPGTYGGQTDVFLAEATTGNWGSNIYIDMWIRPARDAANSMESQFADTNKWLYVYPLGSTGHWCVKLGPRRYTGFRNWDAETSLSPNYTGLFMSFNEQGCATTYSGQNLSGVYMPINTWSRLIVHVNSDDSVSPNMEAWIDPGTGRLVKVAEHTNTFWNIQATSSGGVINTSRIKIGTTFPAEVAMTKYDAWLFVDDVIFATTGSDIDFPPSVPQSLN